MNSSDNPFSTFDKTGNLTTNLGDSVISSVDIMSGLGFSYTYTSD